MSAVTSNKEYRLIQRKKQKGSVSSKPSKKRLRAAKDSNRAWKMKGLLK